MPKEIKCGEGRFPMCPNHVYDAVYAGAAVYMEKGAGEKSGFFGLSSGFSNTGRKKKADFLTNFIGREGRELFRVQKIKKNFGG